MGMKNEIKSNAYKNADTRMRDSAGCMTQTSQSLPVFLHDGTYAVDSLKKLFPKCGEI